MQLINNLQTDILEHLGRFGFLAVSQFQVLTGKSVGYIREMLGGLKRRSYIASYRIEISYKVRAENIYFLTPLGVEFMQSHKVFDGAIKFPISKSPVVTKDYWHRLSFITLHIYLYKFLTDSNITLQAFYTYFDKIGSVKAGTLTAKTKIPLQKGSFYIPDGVMITGDCLYLLEMYCDKDTKRIINQLAQHAQAITLATPAKTFGIDTDPFVLSVFAHPSIKEATIKRLVKNEGFQSVSHLYFFATIQDVQKDIATAFTTIHNSHLLIR